MQITIKKGLDIPLAGRPSGPVQNFPPPKQVALNLDPFSEIRFKVLVKPGDVVKIGEPLVESKAAPGLMLVSPAAGAVKEIKRGLKRRLIDIVIDVAPNEEHYAHGTLDPSSASREEIVALLKRGGLFPYIRMRPFDLVANPETPPRDIFVSALESAPYSPPAELHVAGHERIFQVGLKALSKLTKGKVHLVYRQGSTCRAFVEAEGVERHTVRGPHPAGNHSLHIERIAPIRGPEDYVWTLSTIGVLAIGSLLHKGETHIERVVSIAGNGVLDDKRGYFKMRSGVPISALIAGRIRGELQRFISGDPLTGMKVEQSDFLGFYHSNFTVLPENVERQMLHFLRPGFGKYTATRAYISAYLPPPPDGYAFTTSQHGERRAFIDSSVYEKVMPLRIPTMHLVKALIGEDYELAEVLGLLKVAPDDFALPAFICPSKIEMIEIVREGLRRYSKEMGH